MYVERSLNGICPYYTMFPLEFPLLHLNGLPRGSVVFDPFCGRGTTAFAARLLGYSSVGTDVNPVAVAIARAKLVHVSPERIVRLAHQILDTEKPDPVPPDRFWKLAFAPDTLAAILKLRAGLKKRTGMVADALRGVVLGGLHGPQCKTKDSYLSNQMQRTFAPKPDYALRYWRKHHMLPHEVNVIRLIAERAQRYYSNNVPSPRGRVICGDARRIPLRGVRFDATVTSPPYFGMNMYLADQWLRNWFLGGTDRPDYNRGKQLSGGSQLEFACALGRVWRAVAMRSKPRAKLVIRFGAIASHKSDPESLVRLSLRVSSAPWRIRSIQPAGAAGKGMRQAEQMGIAARKSRAIEELDFVCKLK